MIIQVAEHKPQISEEVAFIAKNSTVAGWVKIEANSSIWFQTVIRSEYAPTTIGHSTNVQDGCVFHTDPGQPLLVGNYVTVGHRVVLHGCTIGDFSLIGINSVVLNGAEIGSYCLIGANSLITENMKIPDGCLVMGSPGKVIRNLTDEEKHLLKSAAEGYVTKSALYNL